MFTTEWWRKCLDHPQVQRALALEALIPGKFTERLAGLPFECWLVISCEYPCRMDHLQGVVERHDDFADRCVCLRRLDSAQYSTIEIGSGLASNMRLLVENGVVIPGEFRGDLLVNRKPLKKVILEVGEEYIIPPGEPHVFYGRHGGAIYLVGKEPACARLLSPEETVTAEA